MIGFNEALKIINRFNDKYDYCTEYADAFVFSKMDELSFGGFNSPTAVMKEDGRFMDFPAYISISKSKEIREGYLKDWQKDL